MSAELWKCFESGGRLENPMHHGFTLEMRALLLRIGAHFYYETAAEFAARMKLAAKANCVRRRCDKVRIALIAEKQYFDEIVFLRPLNRTQVQSVKSLLAIP